MAAGGRPGARRSEGGFTVTSPRRWTRPFIGAALASVLVICFATAARADTEMEIEAEVVRLLNEERAAVGRSPLIVENRLTNAAGEHAQWMADNDTIDHYRGSPGDPMYDAGDRATAAGYNWTHIGEAVAGGYPTPEAVVQAWRNSSGHWLQLGSTSYRDIGVGYVYDDSPGKKSVHYWCVDVGNTTSDPEPLARDLDSDAEGVTSLAAADVDRDGDMDLVAALADLDTVAWYENDGSAIPLWTQRVISSSAGGARAVHPVDLDRDGDVDVVAALEDDDAIVWYESSGTSPLTWTAHTIEDEAYNAKLVSTGDPDGDGDLDVLAGYYDDVASPNEGRLVWYEYDGTTPWYEREVYGAGAFDPHSAYPSDLNGDGQLDVVSGAFSATEDEVRWHRNDGSWTFTTKSITSGADRPESVVVADMNRDGLPDVVSASYDDDKIAWYENGGGSDPTWTSRTISSTADGARSVYVADIDADGDPDVLIASELDDDVAWHVNDGAAPPGWSATTISSVADGARTALVADLDGDGDADYVSGSDGDDRLTWYRNLRIHGSAHFPSRTGIDTAFHGAKSVGTADFDRDGFIDVVGAGVDSAGSIAWWESRLDDTVCPPDCWSTHDVDSSLAWQAAHPADLDGDGDTDVVGASPTDDTVTWWENTGPCGGSGGSCPNWTERDLSTSFDGAWAIDAADFDGDGLMDVVGVADNSENSNSDLSWWWNEGGSPLSWTETVVDSELDGARSVRTGDVDGDGLVDIVVAVSGDGEVAWYENQADSVSCPPTCWATSSVISSFTGATGVDAADVDGDGDIDVLGAGAGTGANVVAWWENVNGVGTVWSEHAVATDFAEAWFVRSGDLDGDGDLDVVAVAKGMATVAWWENTGPCEGLGGACSDWVADEFASDFVAPWAAVPADIDRDGRLDIVAAASDSDEVAWWEGRGGQFTYSTTNTAPDDLLDGETDDLLRIDAFHLGRAGDTDIELATFELLFEESPGDPLTTDEANAVIEELSIYLDADESGAFEIASDTEVVAIDPLSLDGGRQEVTIPDGAGEARLQHGSPRTYFAVVELTSNAGEQDPHMFRVTHVTEGSSTAENRETDVRLEMEWVANSSSSTTPVTLAYFAARPNAAGVRFEWTTATETANVGFNLYEGQAGHWRRINERLIPSQSPDSLEPRDYSFVAQSVSSTEFILEDVAASSSVRRHGPFRLGQSYGVRPDPHPVDWAVVRAEHAAKAISRRSARLDRLRDELQSLAADLVADHRGAATRPALGGREQSDLVAASVEGPTRDEYPKLTVRVAELTVRESGLYRVHYEDLLAEGIDVGSLPLSAVRITGRGMAQPVRLGGGTDDAARGRFGPGSFVEFYARGAKTLYGNTSVYMLEFTPGGGPRMPVDRTRPDMTSNPPAHYTERVTIEADRQYSFGAPNGDPWYAADLLAIDRPVSWSESVPVSDLAPIVEGGSLEVGMWGVTNWPDSPDHHVRIELNGLPVGERWFDGLVDMPVRIELPPGLVVEGANTVRLTAPADTGARWDLVAIDSIALAYPRRPIARDGALAFVGSGVVLAVDGLASDDVVAYRLTDKGPVHLAAVATTPQADGFRAWLPGSAAVDSYLVTEAAQIGIPEISPSRTPSLHLGEPAEYLVVTHADFKRDLVPLVEARRRMGLTVQVVDVEDIYVEYSGGEVDPTAIREFVADSHERSGTRYLLLVGGDTYDYHDNLGLGSVSFIPSLYGATGQIVQFAPLDPLFGELDGDGVPDIPVGRLPVRSSRELQALLGKIERYERKDYPRTALFVADEADGPVSFTALSEVFAAQLAGSWSIERAYLDRLSVEKTRQRIVDAVNEGVALTSFVGHSGPTEWSFQNVFASADATQLRNDSRPTALLQWGCWNTYYVAPRYDTLAHGLLVSADGGAAAVLGAATLTESTSDRALGELVSARVTRPGMPLGRAIIDAKRELSETQPELAEVLLGWTLLGDPMLVVDPIATATGSPAFTGSDAVGDRLDLHLTGRKRSGEPRVQVAP